MQSVMNGISTTDIRFVESCSSGSKTNLSKETHLTTKEMILPQTLQNYQQVQELKLKNKKLQLQKKRLRNKSKRNLNKKQLLPPKGKQKH